MGSDRIGSDRIGSDRICLVLSDRIGSDRALSDFIGSDCGLDQVESDSLFISFSSRFFSFFVSYQLYVCFVTVVASSYFHLLTWYW